MCTVVKMCEVVESVIDGFANDESECREEEFKGGF